MQNSSQLMESSNNHQKQAERYKKIKILGQGSMGRAYLVESTEDDLLYVMKRINIGHLSDKQRQFAMLQAQFYNCLNHPNVIGFKQVYQTTGQKLCMILEYASGGDLQNYLQVQSGKLIPQTTVLNIFSQICLGIQEVHSKHIVHRDLKTANIFLTAEKQVKIGDFGISKRMDKSYLAATSMIGTPYYLSPEMVQGKSYSFKADIWALGIILYQLCSLKLPFEANSLPVLALKILKGAFPPIAQQYSKDIKALIAQMLQVDQKKRPSIQAILLKPIIFKYISKQQQAKIAARQQEKKQIVKEKQSEKVSKVDKQKALNEQKQKSKKDNIEKRQQMRKQMRDDLKKKRAQNQYVSQPSGPKNTISTSASNFSHELKKSPKKDIIQTPKPESTKKQQLIKPWKLKKNTNEKKQIAVEIFVPTLKPKQSKAQQKEQVSNIKVQIYLPKGAKPQQLSQIKQQGRKSAPLINEPVANYHYNSQASNKQISECEEDQHSVEEQIESDDQMEQIIDKIRKLQQLTNNYPELSRPIELYEESESFQSTLPTKQIIKQPQPMQNKLLSPQNLQELRMHLEEQLGQKHFLASYTIIKSYLDKYIQLISQVTEQKDRQLVKQQYIYNEQSLRKELHFLNDLQFKANLQLLYTLIMYEDLQMNTTNTEDEDEMRQSKYSKIL